MALATPTDSGTPENVGIEGVHKRFIVAAERLNVAIRRQANGLKARCSFTSSMWRPAAVRKTAQVGRKSWRLSPLSKPGDTNLHADHGFGSRHGCQTWADG